MSDKIRLLTPQENVLDRLIDDCAGRLLNAVRAARSNDPFAFRSVQAEYQQLVSQAKTQLLLVIQIRTDELERETAHPPAPTPSAQEDREQ